MTHSMKRTTHDTTITSDGRVNLPKLLTARQVYELLGLDKRSFYREPAANRIPQPVRIGTTRTRWRADRVLAWLDSLEA